MDNFTSILLPLKYNFSANLLRDLKLQKTEYRFVPRRSAIFLCIPGQIRQVRAKM